MGEASPLKGLSIDYTDDYQEKLRYFLKKIESTDIPRSVDNLLMFIPTNYSDSRQLGLELETALIDLLNGGSRKLYDNPFSRGEERIPINGLVWMGDHDFMAKQIEEETQSWL